MDVDKVPDGRTDVIVGGLFTQRGIIPLILIAIRL